MKVAKEDSLQRKVREVMGKGVEMKVTEIVKAVPEMANAYQRVTNALRDLARAGLVRKGGPGFYAWVDKIPDLKAKKSQFRMARYMTIRTKKGEPFGCTDVAQMVDCCADWAKRHITRLKKEGFVAVAGKINKRRPVYLATEKAMLVKPEEWPGIQRSGKMQAKEQLAAEVRALAMGIYRKASILKIEHEDLMSEVKKLMALFEINVPVLVLEKEEE